MPLTFTFALSQQRFELRFNSRTRALPPAELIALIEQCETSYYSGKDRDVPEELVALGRRLYQWLDGDEGWLRSHLNTPQPIAFHLTYSTEIQGLNADTDRIALGLAHLPWELLHDGVGFLMQRLLLTMPPVRVVQQREGGTEPKNRPLHLLLMATSPEGIQPVLDYEQEETNIVQATTNQPLLLVTEESGSVTELGNLVRESPSEYFDVFHVTGHGLIYTETDYDYLRRQITPPPQIQENTPCLMTENEVGDVQLTTVADFAAAFGDRFPRVVFLSGCHTGEVPDRGSVPSMAQALVRAGAQTVLGWARPVYDRTAIVAAQALYHSLAASDSIEVAVKGAIAAMIAAKCSDWHLLRVYQDSRGVGALVTPRNTPKREKVKPLRVEEDFLDAEGGKKFEGQFIGRRRPLQRCLRALKPTSDRIGVFLQGMGGLGKSRLAARMCGRVQAQRQTMQRVVLIGVLDELGLLNKLGNLYDQFAEIPALLNQPGVGLKGRLKNFFEAIEALDRPLLLVLDDFEKNIPEATIADGTLRPISGTDGISGAYAYEVLTALCRAIEETQAESRLIITCRYECPLPSRRLHLEKNLDRMNPTDIDKKCRSLTAYAQVRQHPEYERVLRVADGNPRLLEWLLKLLEEGSVDAAALLGRLEAKTLEFWEDILAETLLGALTGEERRFLAQLSGVRLPIALELVNAVADVPPLGLKKVLALGLVESPLRPGRAAEFRVTRILEPLLLPLLSEAEWVESWGRSVRVLYQVWWEEAEGSSEARGLEIRRLGLLAGDREITLKVGDVLTRNWVNDSRFVEALELCQEILTAFEDYRIFGTIARAEAVLGETEKAIAHYQKALDLCPNDDGVQKAANLGNIAGAIAQQGDIDRALELWQQSLDIYEQIGDVQGKAATLNNMALQIAQQGKIDRALELWQQSLDIYEQIDDLKGKTDTLHNMALQTAQQGDIDRALELWQQSLDIYERIGNVKGKAVTLHNMAGVIAQEGAIDRALELWQQSLDIYEQIGDVKGKAATLNNMAGVIAQQGNIDYALNVWQQSLDISDRIGDVKGKAITLNNMAWVIAQEGEPDRAFYLWQQSLGIQERIGDVKGKAATLNNMADIAYQQGDNQKALELFTQSAQAFGQARAYVDLVTVLNNLDAISEKGNCIYLAQAVWLCIRLQAPLQNTLEILQDFFNAVPQGDPLESLLATTANFLCIRRGEGNPQLPQLQELSTKMLMGAASAQGIATPEDLEAWMTRSQFNDPNVFLPRLNQRLEDLVGDGWLFEREGL